MMLESLKHTSGFARCLVCLCGLFFLGIEKLKGTSVVREIIHPACLTGKMIATSLGGYELTVYCRVRHYQRNYMRWFVPTRHHILYQVYSVASNDAPESLKKACEANMTIPSSLHWCVNDAVQEAVAVDAYLDMLIDRLEPRMSRL